jgi:hypothetical protein
MRRWRAEKGPRRGSNQPLEGARATARAENSRLLHVMAQPRDDLERVDVEHGGVELWEVSSTDG